jgi:chromosome segregation ATPase
MSKLLYKKNNEIIKLQKDIFSKTKELEKEKEKEKNKFDKKEKNDKMKSYYENIINEKDAKQLELNSCIKMLKEENELLLSKNEKSKNQIKELNDTIIEYEKQLYQKNEEISKIKMDKINDMKNLQNKDNNIEIDRLKEEIEQLKKNIKNNNSEEEINKLKEENEGLKQFFFKMKDKEEKIIEDNTDLKEKISSLKKENDAFKSYFNDKKVNMPSLSEYNKNMKRDIENKNFNLNDVLIELNNAKKEINILKKKNEDLFNELESKKFDNDFCGHFSEDKAMSNYEEEFDLKKMAKGAKDKNRSQDINIDYPGAQQVKDKFRELDYYYNSLEELVKKLLLNCTCTNKNRAYISELCRIVGFNDEVINKILNNKSKKGLFNLLV